MLGNLTLGTFPTTDLQEGFVIFPVSARDRHGVVGRPLRGFAEVDVVDVAAVVSSLLRQRAGHVEPLLHCQVG